MQRGADGDDFVVDYVRVYDIETAANIAECPGEVGEKMGWKCVGSEEGKVVYIPFEGYYESKGGRIESPRFKLDGEIGKNRFHRLTFSAKCPVDGYWWVDFFDAEGNQLPDVNSRLYASDDWTPYERMCRSGILRRRPARRLRAPASRSTGSSAMRRTTTTVANS